MEDSSSTLPPVEWEPLEPSTDDVPDQELDADDPRRVLRRVARHPLKGEVIAKLASSRFSIAPQEGTSTLAAAMDRATDLFAVAVVNQDDIPIGLILRQDFFDQLGKPHGREYSKRKPVSALMKPARTFREDVNIFGLAEQLKDDLRRIDDTWYLLVDADGKYSGVFSTKNLLIYLSDTTARDIALARRLQNAIVKENLQVEDERFAVSCSSKMAKEVGR